MTPATAIDLFVATVAVDLPVNSTHASGETLIIETLRAIARGNDHQHVARVAVAGQR